MDTLIGGPVAYLLTFHTYGTWLPGDPRGSVDVRHHAAGAPCVGSYPPRLVSSTERLRHAIVLLSEAERAVVLRTVHEVCRHRAWILLAVHVRTNHVHVVVRGEPSPERIMNDLKVWATRRVVEAELRPRGTTLWVRHGSTRYLWTPQSVDAACTYVVEGQGADQEWAARRE
jgi:REP element-mobilizing transposase RayT